MDRIGPNTAIIAAAGSGLRMGGKIKKQFRFLGDTPILIRSLKPFFESDKISNIIVSAPEEDLGDMQELIAEYFRDEEKPLLVVAGGVQRQDSVFCALQNCPKDTNLVFIHDGVRPFINTQLIDELYEIATEDMAVVPASRLKNTVKEINGDYIDSTLVRERLIEVFTPQVFDYKLLCDSYEKAYADGFISTDDSALVEYCGHKVRYLLTGELNLKITDEWDLTIAHLMIEKQFYS